MEVPPLCVEIDMTFMHQRKAVGTVVATVLVVAVALVASLAVSGFVFGVTGRAQNSALLAETGNALRAADFGSTFTASTFTCAPSSSSGYLAVSNTGMGSTSVVAVSLTWAGVTTAYTVSGACEIGASGSAAATMYIIFPPSTLINPSAVSGQSYTGAVTLSSGAQLLLSGTWQ